LNVRP